MSPAHRENLSLWLWKEVFSSVTQPHGITQQNWIANPHGRKERRETDGSGEKDRKKEQCWHIGFTSGSPQSHYSTLHLTTTRVHLFVAFYRNTQLIYSLLENLFLFFQPFLFLLFHHSYTCSKCLSFKLVCKNVSSTLISVFPFNTRNNTLWLDGGILLKIST